MLLKDKGHFKIQGCLFYCFLLLFQWHSDVVVVAQSKIQVVNVGVVLDNRSWIGNISWSCMRMALDDFYDTHPNYTRKLQLHYRDSGSTVFGAAASALDLLKNTKVQAIIGPQTSPQAKFVIELGGKIHVPIISFSAKSPSLSHKKSPCFIRTGFNDLSQAKVIASIIKNFMWKNVIPIYEDTVYGNGILPYLIDSLRDVDANIPYRSPLPPFSTDDDIMSELSKLKNMSTRVFVVHTTYSLGYKLFYNAKKAGMMVDNYVWITTYGLTDIVHLMGHKASSVMQGVIGIRPSVKNTYKLKEFKLRWRKKYAMNITEPTVFGLWAYDTVWALADAVQHASVNNFTFQEMDILTNSSSDFSGLHLSSSGQGIISRLLRTKITHGMSGSFEIIDGQLKSGEFELINFVGNWKKLCSIVGGDEYRYISKIMWPGGKYDKPKGWQWPIEGRKLRIGIPVKPGYGMFVNFENGTAKGYCVEVFKAAIKMLPYHVPCDYIPYKNKSELMNGTYDDLVYQVYLKKFDAVVGDITIIANRSQYVDFTLPFMESGVSMVVPIKDNNSKGALTFLNPLTSGLWFASGGFFIFTGFVVWLLEHRINEDFRGTRSNQLGTIFYFAFSTLVFAHRQQVVSNLARVVLVIWLFVVLVLQSSYTASLTSILTVEKMQPTVTEIDELLKSNATVGYLDESFMPALLGRLKFGENKRIAYQSPKDYHEAFSNKSIAAIFDEVPYLKVFLSQYCNKYVMTGPIYKTDGFGFVFPIGSPLVPDISRAILKVRENDTMNTMEENLYKNDTCPDKDNLSNTSSSLTFRSFWGLFIITGVTSASALIIYIICFLHKHRDLLKSHDSENSVRKRVGSLVKAYDQMDERRKPKRPEIVVEGDVNRDMGDTPFSVSGPLSPGSNSKNGEDRISEVEDGDADEDEMSGREM